MKYTGRCQNDLNVQGWQRQVRRLRLEERVGIAVPQPARVAPTYVAIGGGVI
jgi:hypothetical protein